jgi:hypothetical protein
MTLFLPFSQIASLEEGLLKSAMTYLYSKESRISKLITPLQNPF